MKDKNILNDNEISKVAGGVGDENSNSKAVSPKASVKHQPAMVLAYGGPSTLPSTDVMKKINENLEKLDEKKKEEIPDPAKPVATELLPTQPENKE